MNEQSTLLIYTEQTFTVGEVTFIDSSAENNNAVIFEDNAETGYFYAVNRGIELTILDALHIYNVTDVVDNLRPSVLKILWTQDFFKALLSINNYYHALFDFKNKAGYCRSGFPNSNKSWAVVKDRLLTDKFLEQISNLNCP